MYFQQAMSVLTSAEEYAVGTSDTDTQATKRYFESKRRDYYQQYKNRLPQDIVFYSKPTDLILRHDTNDVGLIHWRPMNHFIKYHQSHKRASSGLTARMINQWHKSKALKRLSREKKQYDEQTADDMLVENDMYYTTPTTIPETVSSHKWRDRFRRLTKFKSKSSLRG